VLLLLWGCGHAELAVAPVQVDFGNVDFQQDIPPEGLSAQDVVISNISDKAVDVVIASFPEDRLVLGGFFPDAPYTFPRLDAGATTTITLGVKHYDEGERDTLVEGSFTLEAKQLKDPVVIGFSYTPVRIIGGDSGT
jgi:hypothetical protein